MALQGIPRQSMRKQGGIKTVFIAPFTGVTDVVITAGMASFASDAGVWKEFKTRKEAGSNYIDKATVNQESGAVAYEKILQMNFINFNVAKRNELAILTTEETIAIVEMNNGSKILVGHEEGLDSGESESNSGSGLVEGSKVGISLRAYETTPTVFISDEDYALVKAGSAVV
ncbi:hypothetical protein GW932_03910 [archaeon]|nr:hypothetical protein [archaeon]